MSEPIVRVRALSKSYPRQKVGAPFWARLVGRAWGWTGALDDWPTLNEGLPVLKEVDLDVRESEILAVTGPSGAGKSTLLHLIGALDLPNQGTILYKAEDVTLMSSARLSAWRNRHVGFVFQFYHLLPELTALENVLVAAMVGNNVRHWMGQRTQARQRATELLERFGLGGRLRHRPAKLSGGERQRVAIARALMNEPDLLLADEPTGNLDARTGQQILEVFAELHQRGQTIVMVTHDANVAARADRRLVLQAGQLARNHGA